MKNKKSPEPGKRHRAEDIAAYHTMTQGVGKWDKPYKRATDWLYSRAFTRGRISAFEEMKTWKSH